MDAFFAYRALSDEIDAKLAALTRPAAETEAALVVDVEARGLRPAEVARVRDLLTALRACPFDEVYANYLAHPVRVAAAYFRDRPALGYRGVALALCHNFRETAVRGQDEIEREFLGAGISRALDLLFTDRARERDPRYLDAFYDGIASGPAGLMELKAHDKLDNFLSYVVYDVERYHYEVVETWVLPRLRSVNARLTDYLAETLRYVSDPAVRRACHPGAGVAR